MYAFEKVYPGIQTYVFGADLYKITDDFRGKDFKKVLNNIADHVPIWSGGTLIGKSLNSFVSKHFYQRVNSKTILMIVSDGLDTGNSESVAHSMKTLKRRTRKVVWINPLASHENYKPTAAAMAAAMPFIDQFISGHNLQSLKEMLSKLVK